MNSLSPRFHELTVKDVTKETKDAVSVAFDVPPQLADAYRFEPGQYLTLKADIAGESVRRSYSISSGPFDAELRIAIKAVEGGVFSTWANAELKAGHAIDVMTPTGRFGLSRRTGSDRVLVGFAAGSGITPILSIMRGALDGDRDGRFFLFYGNKSSEDILYKGALEELKDRYTGRLSVFHVLSREEQDIPVLNGRLDGAKARILLRSIVPWEIVDDVYICGPEEMIADLEATCRAIGIEPDRIHSERFVSAHGGKRKPVAVPRGDAATHVASLVLDGKRRDVLVADGETILDAALRAGLDLPYACKGGMCSTCRAKVAEGETAMEVNYSLEPWELKAGFVLTCQARPVSDRVVIDFDAV
ncbi:MAG: phenylacetate-CoA oxygenase/reductase subunit PaaK [Beijerinckiaceae bacterium]|nr:phenylacetate-CoA oxygenase/reductase subunit PaaK [Beijerinckiaceae bacterium]